MNKVTKGYFVLELILYISIFIAFFAMIFSSMKIFEAYQILEDKFYVGKLKVDDFQCIKIYSSNSAPSNCKVIGNVYSQQDILACKDQVVFLGIHTSIDFSKKEFKVFYRKDCRFSIWNENNHSSFPKEIYIEKIFLLFLVHFVFILLLFIALKINNKL